MSRPADPSRPPALVPGPPIPWVRQLRRRLGVSQAQLGELLDVDRTSVAFYENGTRSPSGTRLRILRAAERALANKWPPREVYPEGDLSVDQRLAQLFHCAITLPDLAR